MLNIKIFKILRKKGALINNRKREENAKFIVFWRIYDVRSVPLFALGKRNKFDLWLKNAKLVDLINRNPALFFFGLRLICSYRSYQISLSAKLEFSSLKNASVPRKSF